MKKRKYKAKGRICFFFNKGQIDTFIWDAPKELEDEYISPLYDFSTGLEFLNCVKRLGFTNNDGHITNIFVNGYISNLGLIHFGDKGGLTFCQGDFIVDEDTFAIICKHYKVEVNWANK